MDEFIQAHRRIMRDYRLALGLTLSTIRRDRNLSLSEIAAQTGIPEQTLRSYERGAHQPQIQRLVALAQAFNTSLFGILMSVSEYVYRASGRPCPDPDRESDERIRLYILLLYCGVSPDDIKTMESTDPSWRRLDR
jgi:transcriptional regulator with XRE-family HTH domain